MRRILSIFLMLTAVAAVAGQQSEPAEQQPGSDDTRSRDLSTMFYTDTLPASNISAAAAAAKPAAKAAPLKRTSSSSNTPAVTAGGMERRVGVKLSLLMHDAECNVEEVPATRVFRSGEQIRLLIESNIDGYLSVLEKGSSGGELLLFPNARINGGQNQVQRGIQYSIPSTGWFTFNSQPGEEHLLVVVSRKPLSWLPGATAAPDSSSQTPPVQMTATLNALEQSVHARDLVLFEEKAPQVGEQPQIAQSLIALNTSGAHNDMVYVRLTLKHR